MSEHSLPCIARRILNRPQLISEAGALAVLGALAPRLGVVRMFDGAGMDVDLPAALSSQADVEVFDSEPGQEVASRTTLRRDFRFDEETGIACIPIEGELVHRFGYLDPYSGMTGYDGIKRKVRAAANDPEVRGILLDIDSPGGEVYGCEGAAEVIFKAREAKPIWALINEQATSAAYWLASAAHNVFAPSTADSGSIGVFTLHVDISGALKQDGLVVTIIHAGAHKVDGHSLAPLPDDVFDELQDKMEVIRKLFAGTVARNRGLSIETVLATEARVYKGPEAVAADLVDDVYSEVEVFEDFAERLARPESVALLPTG